MLLDIKKAIIFYSKKYILQHTYSKPTLNVGSFVPEVVEVVRQMGEREGWLYEWVDGGGGWLALGGLEWVGVGRRLVASWGGSS